MPRKPKKTRKKLSATAVATRAGCSRQLAARLLARGFSEQQIIDRVRERKEREQSRAGHSAASGGRVNGYDIDEFPTVPVPGLEPVPPFAVSEAAKEQALAQIRQLQAAKLRGTVLPVEPMRAVVFAATRFLVDRLRDLPDELTDELGPELTKLLRVRIQAVVDESRRVLRWEAARVGVSVPPDPSPEVRRRLA